MDWSDVSKIVFTMLTSLGGASLIIFAFSSWLSKVWANRILEADRAKYAGEMESIKLANQNFSNSISLANSASLEMHKSFVEHRIIAISDVWKEIVTLRENKPSAIIWLDILTFSEYEQFYTVGKLAFAKDQTSLENLNSLLKVDGIDIGRPFLDERSYQIFWVYRALIGRLSFYINKFYSNEVPTESWRKDCGVISLLEGVLSIEDLDKFHKETWSTIDLFQYLESILVAHLRNIASGVDLANEALDNSLKRSAVATKFYKDQAESELS